MLQRLSDMLGLGLTPYAMAAVIVLCLYTIQSELRFGAKARAMRGGSSDRGSTIALSLASLVPVAGFLITVRAQRFSQLFHVPGWLIWPGAVPLMVSAAWAGVALGVLGFLLRLWAVLTLRQRYTRTLLVHDEHAFERGGPYRFVRHPGYLGSLLCLNGFALASASVAVFAISAAATVAAYAYRIRVEDRMLVGRFGAPYEDYRRKVGALLPFVR
jgi:protein-S-isoprenylcysteine O-methyltransferase Ste14